MRALRSSHWQGKLPEHKHPDQSPGLYRLEVQFRSNLPLRFEGLGRHPSDEARHRVLQMPRTRAAAVTRLTHVTHALQWNASKLLPRRIGPQSGDMSSNGAQQRHHEVPKHLPGGCRSFKAAARDVKQCGARTRARFIHLHV